MWYVYLRGPDEPSVRLRCRGRSTVEGNILDMPGDSLRSYSQEGSTWRCGLLSPLLRSLVQFHRCCLLANKVENTKSACAPMGQLESGRVSYHVSGMPDINRL